MLPAQPAPVKDIPKRKALMAFLSLPMMFFFATIITLPIVIGGFFLSGPGAGGEVSVNITLAILGTVLAELVAIGVGLKWTDSFGKLKETLMLSRPKLRYLIYGGLIGAGAFVGLQLVANGMGALGYEVGSSETSLLIGQATGIERIIVLFLLVPIVVPFVEELFFRGYILGMLKGSRLSKSWIGVLLSSVFFAAAHFQGFSTPTDVTIFLWIGIMAAVYAMLTLKAKSIWPSYTAHLVYNGITVAIMLIGAA